MNNLQSSLQKLKRFFKGEKVAMTFEQRVCQCFGVVVFLMSAAFYGLGFYGLPILESYATFFIVCIVMLVMTLTRKLSCYIKAKK